MDTLIDKWLIPIATTVIGGLLLSAVAWGVYVIRQRIGTRRWLLRTFEKLLQSGNYPVTQHISDSEQAWRHRAERDLVLAFDPPDGNRIRTALSYWAQRKLESLLKSGPVDAQRFLRAMQSAWSGSSCASRAPSRIGSPAGVRRQAVSPRASGAGRAGAGRGRLGPLRRCR